MTSISVAMEGVFNFSDLTPLFYAVDSGDLAFIVNYFSNDTADLKGKMMGEYGAKLITFACRTNEATAERHHLNQRREKQLEIVKFLIEKGADVNRRCSVSGKTSEGLDCITPIFAAAREANEPLVRLLLAHGADPSIETTPRKLTPLHLAAFLGSPDICEMLLRSGADISQRDVEGNTPLILACAAGHSNVCRVILKWSNSSGVKVDVNARTKTRQITALHAAVFGGNLETVELLQVSGASVNAKTSEGHTALDMAIFTRNDKIRKLLDRGETSTFNTKKGKGPKPLQAYLPLSYGFPNALFSAAFANFLDDMKYLVEQGCDVNAKDLKGLSPLFSAVIAGNVKVVKFLLDAKAEVNVESLHPADGFPLHSAALMGFEQIAALLLKHGAKVINFGSSCAPLLFSAAFVGRFPAWVDKKNFMIRKGKISEKLILEGAPIDEKYADLTPLKFARRVENGCVADVINRQITLFRSIDQQNLTELKACLKRGALPNCYSVRYGTPLLYAVVRNNLDIVSCLIEHGANVNLIPPGRDSALHYAAKNNFLAVARKLLASGAAFDARSEASGGKTPREVCVDGSCETALLLNFVQRMFDLAPAMDLVTLSDVLTLVFKARGSNCASAGGVSGAARGVENVPHN